VSAPGFPVRSCHGQQKFGLNTYGVHIVESKSYTISTDQSRRSFYCAADAIFGGIGRIVSEEVVSLQMLTKYIPVLLYIRSGSLPVEEN